MTKQTNSPEFPKVILVTRIGFFAILISAYISGGFLQAFVFNPRLKQVNLRLDKLDSNAKVSLYRWGISSAARDSQFHILSIHTAKLDSTDALVVEAIRILHSHDKPLQSVDPTFKPTRPPFLDTILKK